MVNTDQFQNEASEIIGIKLRFRVLNDGSDPQSYRAEVCEICRKLNEFQQLCVTLTENLCFRMGSRWNPRLVQSVGFGPVWDSNAGSHLVSPDASAWDSLNRQPGPGSSISLLHSISHPTYCPTYLPPLNRQISCGRNKSRTRSTLLHTAQMLPAQEQPQSDGCTV